MASVGLWGLSIMTMPSEVVTKPWLQPRISFSTNTLDVSCFISALPQLRFPSPAIILPVGFTSGPAIGTLGANHRRVGGTDAPTVSVGHHSCDTDGVRSPGRLPR